LALSAGKADRYLPSLSRLARPQQPPALATTVTDPFHLPSPSPNTAIMSVEGFDRKHSVTSAEIFALSQCPMLGRVRQGGADLAAIEPHVSQLAVVKNAQGGESGLMFALSDNGRDPVVDESEKSSANAADNLPYVRRIGIT
jgi:hypothetical protein